MITAIERAYVWLSMTEGLGPRRVAQLLTFCGDAQELLSLPYSAWEHVVGAVVAGNMRTAKEKLDDTIAKLEATSCRVLSRESPGYPQRLLEVYDPPTVLYVKGDADLNHPQMVAMVGSRRCTRYGQEMSHILASGLAKEGICVVSGMARGVDSFCHIGALAGKGITIGVLGCGYNVVYPKENAKLYEQVLEQGALVSEYLPHVPPTPGHFPMRNRIISGMSQAVTLIEAASGSGAMITIEYALEHGRDIFAVPGNVTSSQSFACNRLLQDGAGMATCAKDILIGMGWQKKQSQSPQARIQVQLSFEEAKIVAAAKDQEMSFEELAVETGFTPSVLNSHLTMLTLRGIMKQSPGRVFSINRI